MRLKTVLLVVFTSVIGVVIASFFTGQVLLSQVLVPFQSLEGKSELDTPEGEIISLQTFDPRAVDGSGPIEPKNAISFVSGDIVSAWIPWIIKQASILIGGLSLVVFVYAGVSLIIKGESEEELTKSAKMLIFGIVGIALAGFSYSIVANVLALFS